MKNKNKNKNKSLQTWAKILPFLAPYKKEMGIIIAMMLGAAAIDTITPLFSGYAVDNFIGPRTTDGLLGFTLAHLTLTLLMTAGTIAMYKYQSVYRSAEFFLHSSQQSYRSTSMPLPDRE